jgi:YD repeat-containing protein
MNHSHNFPNSPALIHLAFIFLIVLLLAGVAAGQSSWSATTGTTPTSMSPGAPAGSYSLSGFESVGLYDRRINFDMKLLHIGGRGAAGFDIQLPMQVQWQESHYGYPTGCTQGGCSGWNDVVVPTPNSWKMQPTFSPGVMFSRSAVDGKYDHVNDQGVVVCTTYNASLTRLTFSAADGTEYELRDTIYDGQPQATTCPYGSANRGRVFVSKDGSGMTFTSDSDIWDAIGPTSGPSYQSGYLLFKDGTRYRIDSGNVSWIRDRNGNKITFGGGGITDSLGRTVTITNTSTTGGATGYYQIAFTGVGGGVTRYIRINYDYLHNLLISGSTQSMSQLFPYLPNASTQGTFDPGATLSSVVLPDGRQYSFKYNAYAELSRIDLPTGGRIEYDYQLPETSSVHHFVSERRVYTDGNNPSTLESKTQYPGDGTVDHLTAGGVLLSREKHYFFGIPYNESLFNNHPTDYSNWQNGREYLTEYYAADGTTLLRSTALGWQQRTPVTWCPSCVNMPPNDPDVVTTVSTLADVSPNLVTKTTSINPQTGVLAFDQFNNPTDAWEYDYGSNGAPSTYPVRHTHTDYLTTNPVNGIDYTLYTGAHIRSLSTAHKIYSVNPSNGNETLVAQNASSYDETNSIPC